MFVAHFDFLLKTKTDNFNSGEIFDIRNPETDFLFIDNSADVYYFL